MILKFRFVKLKCIRIQLKWLTEACQRSKTLRLKSWPPCHDVQDAENRRRCVNFQHAMSVCVVECPNSHKSYLTYSASPQINAGHVHVHKHHRGNINASGTATATSDKMK